MLGIDIAKAANPLLGYFFYAQVILLCLAILVGCLLLLKRIVKRQPFEGDPSFDNERIASEIQAEIIRLTDLRNRLDPKLEAEAKASGATAQAAPAPSAAHEDHAKALADKDALIVALETQIAELKSKLDALGAAAPATTPPADESAAKIQELSTQVTKLETTVNEYKIFDDDWKQVKQIQEENEKLKIELAELKASGVTTVKAAAPTTASTTTQTTAASSPTPEPSPAPPAAVAQEAAPAVATTPETPVTEDDISSLFQQLEENKAQSPQVFKGTPSSQPAPETATSVSPAPESVAAATTAPPPEAAKPSTKASAVTDDNAEAIAESINEDDELMAEFEKLLSEPVAAAPESAGGNPVAKEGSST